MNWTALGAMGELIGAVGVIVSILYLARSVSSSASFQRRAANHDILDSTSILFMALGQNAEVSSVWLRGMADFMSLKGEERVMLSALLLNMAYSWEEVFHAQQAQQVDQFAVDRMMATQSELLMLPGFRTWWSARRTWLGPDFREFLDAEMARYDEAITPMYKASGPVSQGGAEGEIASESGATASDTESTPEAAANQAS